MKELKLYREDNGQYYTNEARQDDVSGAYVQKTDYDELRADHYDERAKVQELLKENAELRAGNIELQRSEVNFKAMNEVLRLAIKSLQYSKENNSGAEPSISVFHRDIDQLIELGSLTPEQHLADIKADAVIALTEQDYGYSVEIGGYTDEWVISVDQILAYANKLRGESK